MELTKELLDSLFEYKDGNLYAKISRGNKAKGSKLGTLTKYGYIRIVINRTSHMAHRIIFIMFNGYIPKFIDHINMNKSDNRIENLREASKIENGYNRKKYKNNKSGAKNVFYNKKTNKWLVYIKVNKKRIYFGSYDCFEFANLAAIEARNKHHGIFSRHN